MIPVDDYAKEVSIFASEIIHKIKAGQIKGQRIKGEWFVHDSEMAKIQIESKSINSKNESNEIETMNLEFLPDRNMKEGGPKKLSKNPDEVIDWSTVTPDQKPFISDTKKCPFCAEDIKTDAIKCRYCGEFLRNQEAVTDKAGSLSLLKPQPHYVPQTARSSAMQKTTKLRLIGGAVLLFNLWLIGRYNLQGIPVLLLTFGFAFGYEFLVVRPSKPKNNSKSDKSPQERGH